jgi:hypothetical protein
MRISQTAVICVLELWNPCYKSMGIYLINPNQNQPDEVIQRGEFLVRIKISILLEHRRNALHQGKSNLGMGKIVNMHLDEK